MRYCQFENSKRPPSDWLSGGDYISAIDMIHADIANNLVHGKIRLEGGQAKLRQNKTGHLNGYFVDPASGNLALTSTATRAIDKGIPLPEVSEDIRQNARAGNLPDIGACEFKNALSIKP